MIPSEEKLGLPHSDANWGTHNLYTPGFGTIPKRGISAGMKRKPDSSFCSVSSITLEFPCCLATAAAETRALSLGTREGITLQMARFKELEGERRNPHITLGGFLPSHPHSLWKGYVV